MQDRKSKTNIVWKDVFKIKEKPVKLTVKNAESDPATSAEILIKNKINYIPKVSVVMPVYNAEPYLRTCLDSVVNQTLKKIEIICVDDGSTDRSLEILKNYALKDGRITVISQKNLHAGVARNAGLSAARGKYVHFLDADDWIDTDTYEELYRLIEAQNVSFIKFKSYSYDMVKQKIIENDYTEMPFIKQDSVVDFEKDIQLVKRISDAPWSGIYNRKFLEKNEIRFDNFICSNDVGFYFRCLVHARTFYFSTKKFVYYRINNNKSLIGIRPFHFDCQIDTFYRVHEIVKNESEQVRTLLDNSFSWSVLWRFKMYIEDEQLPSYAKKKIKQLTDAFFKKNQHLRYAKDYEDYCNNPTKVSVIIPVYNAEPYLRQCLDSVIYQTLKDIEIVCVDDGSTDCSLDIIREYMQHDERICLYRLNRKKAGAARNLGVRMSHGQYVYFADSDDWLDRECLKKLYNQIKKSQSDICICGVTKYDNQEKIEIKNSYTDMSCFKDRPCDVCNYKDIKDFIFRRFAAYFELYRRDFFIKNDLFFQEDILIGEDVLPHVKSLLLAYSICFCDENLYYYRVNRKGSLMATSQGNQNIFDVFSYIKNVENFLVEHGYFSELEQQFINFVLEQLIFHFGRMADKGVQHDFIQKSIQYINHLNVCKLLKSPYCGKFESLMHYKINSLKTVSVIIPVYNVEPYLEQCLNSVINQTLKNIEIICVNDGSKDHSLRILKDFAKKENRITIINQKNQGLSMARNNAMKIAKGQYIFFLDSDDYIKSDALDKLYSYATGNHLDRVSFEGQNFVDGTNLLMDNKYWLFDFLPAKFNTRCYTYRDCLSFVNKMPVSSCLSMYRNNFIKEHHLDFPKGLFFEDNVFFIKSFLLAQRSGIIKEKFYCRRIHDASVTQNWDKHFADFIKIIDIVLEWIQKNYQFLYPLYQNGYLNYAQNTYKKFSSEYRKKYYKPLKKLFDKYEFRQANIYPNYNVFLSYLFYPLYTLKLRRLLKKYLSRVLMAFRVDIKNFGNAKNAVEIQAGDVHVSSPVWFIDSRGIGSKVEGFNSKLSQTITIKAIQNGRLQLDFRGPDARFHDVRFPVWIDYESIQINGKEILSKPIETWHDKPYRYEMPVKNGQQITVSFRQTPHIYTFSELKATLFKICPKSSYLKKNIKRIARWF